MPNRSQQIKQPDSMMRKYCSLSFSACLISVSGRSLLLLYIPQSHLRFEAVGGNHHGLAPNSAIRLSASPKKLA